MRIVNYIEHPRLKITIFNHNAAFSVKFEAGKMEQIIQFREGEMHSDTDVIDFVKGKVLESIDKHFYNISESRVLFSKLKSTDDEFEIII